MRTIVNAIISFDLVAIPVAVSGAVSSKNEPKFRTLHEKCGTPIRQDNVCPACGEIAFETVKGYEVAKNQFLHFTPDEIASVSSDRDNTIELRKFVKAADITARHVTKQYWLVPPQNEKLAEKYGLLYQSLAEMKKAGLGTESLWGTEHPCAIRASTAYPALELCILHLAEDLVEPDFVPAIPGREEKSMAKFLIDSKSGDFDPEKDLVSVSRQRTQELISARLEGADLPQYGAPAEHAEEVDLMGALRASVEKIEKKKAKTNSAKKRKAATKA